MKIVDYEGRTCTFPNTAAGMRALGVWCRLERELWQMTHAEVARAAGCTHQTVRNFEEKTRFPRAQTRDGILAALGINIVGSYEVAAQRMAS